MVGVLSYAGSCGVCEHAESRSIDAMIRVRKPRGSSSRRTRSWLIGT